MRTALLNLRIAISLGLLCAPACFAAPSIDATDKLCERAMGTMFSYQKIQVMQVRQMLSQRSWESAQSQAKSILASQATAAERECAQAALSLSTERLAEEQAGRQRQIAERERQIQAQKAAEEQRRKRAIDSYRAKKLDVSAPDIQALVSTAGQIGPGDLRLYMTWAQAKQTEFIRTSTILWEMSEGPFSDAERGRICYGPYFGKMDFIACSETRPTGHRSVGECQRQTRQGERCIETASGIVITKQAEDAIPFEDWGQFNFDLRLRQNLFGERRLVTVKFSHHHVFAIIIEMQASTRQSTLQKEVLQTLTGRYGEFIGPNSREMQYFNEGRTKCVSHVNQQRNVALVRREEIVTVLYTLIPVDHPQLQGDKSCLPEAITNRPQHKL